MRDFKTCATAAGFCTIKLGPPESINFDHNICYDLINVDYPSSYIAEGVKEVYTFECIIARPANLGSTQGIQVFDDEVVAIMAELELKCWNMLSCLALGISGGGGCKAHVPKHQITIPMKYLAIAPKMPKLSPQLARFSVAAKVCDTNGSE